MKRYQSSRTGFTLIELLVVIAIIAILAAILFPVFAKAREKARQITCASNEKQIGLAVMQYVQDFDERMPSTRMGAGNNWQVTLQPYIKSYQVFTCPSNPRNSTLMNDGANSNPGGTSKTMVSYAAPEEIVPNGAAFGAQEAAGPAISDFPAPSQTIMVCEGNTADTDFRLSGASWEGSNAQDSGGKPALFAGHMGQLNLLFADGHVKSMKPMSTIPNIPSSNMYGSGTVNMWDRQNTTTFGGWGDRLNDMLTNATNYYK